MPKKSGKSKVFSDSLKKRYNASKTESMSLPSGGGSLPPGIENGVAKVVSMKVDVYGPDTRNPGKPYFMVRGVTVLPKVHDGVPIEGIQESFVMEPLFSTPTRSRKTEEEHVDYLLAVLQSFGVDTAETDPESIDDGTLFAAIVESGQHLRFRTWQGEPTDDFPNPRVNITFLSGCEYEGDDEGTDDVQDDTEEESDEGAHDSAMDVATADLAALVGAAEADDADASKKLTELAAAAGIDAEEIETWQEVADAIEGSDVSSGGEEEADDEFLPAKGEVYLYKPPKSRKQVECEVTAVFEGKQTANLKNSNNGTSYRGVPWDSLAEPA